MPDITDGGVATVEATTEPVEPTESTTQAASDKGAQARIDGLTAERNRTREANDKLTAEIATLKEQNKTDDERRIDELVTARVESEYGGQLQRLKKLEDTLAAKRDTILETVPEEHRGMIDDTAPVEMQITQAEGVLKLLKETNSGPVVIPAPGGDTPPDSTEYTYQQYQDYRMLPREERAKRRPEMEKAYREGRIKGTPNYSLAGRGQNATERLRERNG